MAKLPAKESNWTATTNSHTMSQKKRRTDQTLTPYHRRSAEQIKDLNVGPETVQLLKGSLGSMLSDISLSNILEGMSPQARETKYKRMGPTQNLLYSEENWQLNEKTAY